MKTSSRHQYSSLRYRNLILPFAAFCIGWSAKPSGNRTCFCGHPSQQVVTQKVGSERSLAPLEHSPKHFDFSFTAGLARLGLQEQSVTSTTDIFTPFHRWMMEFGAPSNHNISDLPLFYTWIHYFEAYHNHMARFRNQKEVVFMEVGVQSGGKIPLLRKYFGPGLVYIGLDINPSTKMFETQGNEDFTVQIEIGDSANPEFLDEIKQKYPHVDIFLDDGGHTMEQQIVAMKHMLPHVQPEGIYICEDLATSWMTMFGGREKGFVGGRPDFTRKTMVGYIHQTLDWLMASSVGSESLIMKDNVEDLPEDLFRDSWWRTIPSQVKHIHYYNQIVVYEKGVTYRPVSWAAAGNFIPHKDSGRHPQVNWMPMIQKLDAIFGESLL